MDFLKLIVFSTLIRYLYRCNIFPVSKISVPFGSVSSRQNVHFICKHFMNNTHPALTVVLSAHGGVANVVFDKAQHLIVHCFLARLAEMDAYHVSGLSNLSDNHGCGLLGGCGCCVLCFCH